jgi:Domain of unknown function (DUF4148)
MTPVNLLVALTTALSAAHALATEATQFVPPSGSLTRAEVRAELARARAAGELDQVSATYGAFALPQAPARDRALARVTPDAKPPLLIDTDAIRAAAHRALLAQRVEPR